ncbi:MAG: imelysin family protein [Balneola sp.]
MKRYLLLFLSASLIISSCTETNPSGPDPDDFDRKAILENWADNIIIPALSDFSEKTESLKTAGNSFAENPNQQALESLRDEWKAGYLALQHVSMFETSKTMEIRYRNNLNIYPVDTAEVKENINQGNYNLKLPSEIDQQGFPTLDYLLYGLAGNEDEILSFYTSGENSSDYRNYVVDLVNRIDSLTDVVLNDWNSGFRDEFVNNSGNGANSSIDMMVNDFIFYYEKNLRAGKIGIPAGVFSGTPLPQNVEGFYSGEFSKELFMESLTATQNFFNGKHFNSETSGLSLSDYLDFLNSIKNGTDLTQLINQQFELSRNKAENMNSSFADQVEIDNSLMLQTYDELQKNVILLKVDMLQALNINVDYVDADGD